MPTLREAASLPLLTARLEALRSEQGLDFEVLVMDDDSRDGSREWAEELAPPWLKFIVRTENPGLGHAVAEGLGLASNPYVVVLDADLSHPPEKIP